VNTILKCFLLIGLSLPIAVVAQEPKNETLSEGDIARLSAFVGDIGRVMKAAQKGSVAVDGIYKVREGDTLSSIVTREFRGVDVNPVLISDVIVTLNPHAFPRGNPNWLLSGKDLQLPSEQDFRNYIFPGSKTKSDTSSRDWVRYP
jgi:hypothetical protein